MNTLNKVLVQRLQLQNAGRLSVVENAPGIVCAAVVGDPEASAMLLLWDEADNNPGPSLSNGIAAVLTHLAKTWPATFPWNACIAVECDSMGDFDLLRLNSGASVEFGGWSPVRWPQLPPRSWPAVCAMLGPKIVAAREAVRAVAPNCGA